MKKVLLFGTFDPLHPGHEYLFREARALGDTLTVVVSRDSAIQREKKREPHVPETLRLGAVLVAPNVDEALLGDDDPNSYALLREIDFTILAVGYDQKPEDVEIRAILDRMGKQNAQIVRLQAHKPDQYKSSLLRT